MEKELRVNKFEAGIILFYLLILKSYDGASLVAQG